MAATSPTTPQSISSTHTPGNTVYLLTGATRGIGASMLAHILSKPHHTAIVLHRPSAEFPPAVKPALASRAHATSALIGCEYTATQSAADVHWLAASLRDTHGIARIDVLMASAGMAESLQRVLDTPWTAVQQHMEVNLGGVLKLVQGLRGLLGLEHESGRPFPPEVSTARKSAGFKGSTVALMSSSVACMTSPEPKEISGVAYGTSKASLNYLASRLHVEFAAAPYHLCALALHPGWVRTGMGKAAARAWGMPEDTPPLSADESARGCLALVEQARPHGATEAEEAEGGKFWDWNGKQLPW